jgi:transposase-like protein
MLSSYQESVLDGLLLGDGCLYLPKGCVNPKLIVARSERDFNYLHDNCRTFGINPDEKIYKRSQIKNDKKYISYRFETPCLVDFLKPYKNWYKNGTKVVPRNLKINPVKLGTWFADDGSINIGRSSRLSLATHGFSYEDVKFLQTLLKQKGLNFRVVKANKNKKNYFTLNITNRKDILSFYEYVEIPNSMERKKIVFQNNLEKLKPIKRPPCIVCGSNNVTGRGAQKSNQHKKRYFCKNCKKDYFIYSGAKYKLSIPNVVDILTLRRDGSKLIDLARLFNVSKSTIGNIINNKLPSYLICNNIISNSFIICGEGNNYCSLACYKLAMLFNNSNSNEDIISSQE